MGVGRVIRPSFLLSERRAASVSSCAGASLAASVCRRGRPRRARDVPDGSDSSRCDDTTLMRYASRLVTVSCPAPLSQCVFQKAAPLRKPRAKTGGEVRRKGRLRLGGGCGRGRGSNLLMLLFFAPPMLKKSGSGNSVNVQSV